MLTITVQETELFNDETQEFFTEPSVTLELEHSLATLSKWESKFEKPFLGKDRKTDEETLWYIKLMCNDPKVPLEVFYRLTQKNIEEVNEYIEAKMTATWFSNEKPSRSGEIITAELIYFWMINYNIPFECEHWHLNRLLTLIQVCSKKNEPKKKMTRAQILARNRMLNAQRQQQLGTSG